MSERKSKNGQLLGPKSAAEWLSWRQARDKAIANPRRLKSVRDAEKKTAPTTDTKDPT